MDALLVTYTGVATTTVPILPNQNLQTILQNIDLSIAAHNTAPDYSGYNLYCVKQTDGVSHPTNTQNFAEGISKNLCDFHTAYNTFTGTTYVNNQTILTTAINGLQVPGLSYTHSAGGLSISIANTDTQLQILTKLATAIGNTGDLLGAPGSTWGTLSISTPTNINTAFNSLIAYLSALTTTVNGKQSTIGTFNNSGNCLSTIGGTSTDSLVTTIGLLTTYGCSLPVFSAAGITWGGVTLASTLQGTVQNTINSVSYLLQHGVIAAGTGLTASVVGTTYQGYKLGIDTTYTQLYKTMVDSADTTPGFLSHKIVAGTGISLTINNVGADETITIANTIATANQVAVNSSDTVPGYLASKIPSTYDPSWGLSMTSTAGQNNATLQLVPSVSNPSLFNQSIMNYIASDPTLLAQFAGLVALSASAPGTPVNNLVASLSTINFALAWTHQSGSAQNAKWRQFGQAEWSLFGFTTANPMTGTAVANTIPAPSSNTVYEFQIDTVYSTGTIGSNISQAIFYLQQTLTYTVVAGVISVNQSPLQIDTIQYRLKSGTTVLQNKSTTGAIPNVSFASVGAGSYTVEWRFGTLINGYTLYSDDVTQHGSWYVSSTITV